MISHKTYSFFSFFFSIHSVFSLRRILVSNNLSYQPQTLVRTTLKFFLPSTYFVGPLSTHSLSYSHHSPHSISSSQPTNLDQWRQRSRRFDHRIKPANPDLNTPSIHQVKESLIWNRGIQFISTLFSILTYFHLVTFAYFHLCAYMHDSLYALIWYIRIFRAYFYFHINKRYLHF